MFHRRESVRPSRILFALAAVGAGTLQPLVAQSAGSWSESGGGYPADDRESYSYVRTIEGRASLSTTGNGPGEEAGINQILQRGDRIRVERSARMEIVLADRNLLRVAGGSDLTLVRVAFSADGDDRSTELDLQRGELLLEVTEDALGDELPMIRTLTAQIFVNEPGTYRVRAESDGYTELVVRSGYAELLTERGSTIVRTGEEAWTTGDRWQPVELVNAGPRDALERWGEELLEQAQTASDEVPYVEPELAYSASSMADYGNWVSVDDSWYWTPRVASGWSPYHDGRWGWSPSGLTWISYEPWGWVPYHYGTWCQLPGYGWAWRPGAYYSPAWVYWYWSPTWTGWCPIGYYTNFYRGYWNSGFRWGVYGWAGGSWGHYKNWNFCPTTRVCDRGWDGGWRRGDRIPDSDASTPNGIVTTDTRGVPRDRWDRPTEIVKVLERYPGDGRRRELPEVTDFVARRTDLPPTVDAAVRPDPTDRGSRRRGTPLDPGSVTAVDRGRGSDRGRDGSTVTAEEQPGWRSRTGGGLSVGLGSPSERGRTQPPSGGRVAAQNPPTTSSHSTRVPTPQPDPRVDVRRPDGSERGAPVANPRDRETVDGTQTGRGRPAAPAADDRQGWRSAQPSPRTTPREAPQPGQRWQQPPPTVSVDRRPPVERSSPDAGGAPRREPPTSGQGSGQDAGRGASDPRTAPRTDAGSDRRYGFPAREIGSPTPYGGSEPIDRVIGGVRRSAPDATTPRGSAPPRVAPGAPSSGGNRYGAPPSRGSAAPGYVVPQAGARTAPPSSAGSAPRTSTGGQRGATVSPPSSGGGRGSQSGGQSGGQVRSGSQQGSSSSSSNNSSSSSSSSSPPPSRGRRSNGGG